MDGCVGSAVSPRRALKLGTREDAMLPALSHAVEQWKPFGVIALEYVPGSPHHRREKRGPIGVCLRFHLPTPTLCHRCVGKFEVQDRLPLDLKLYDIEYQFISR